MGILTNNINETGIQILQIEASVLDNINSITFSLSQLESELNAMKSNQEFTEEDILELTDLINNIKLKISNI